MIPTIGLGIYWGFFCVCQSFQKEQNFCWKVFSFRMDVFNFQYPLPEIFDFLISKVLKLHDQKGCWGLLRYFGLFEFC